MGSAPSAGALGQTATQRSAPARSMARALRDALAAWLPALPLLLLAALLLVIPAMLMIVQSFSTEAGLSLANWGKVLSNRNDQRAIVTSLELAALSATLAMLIGTPAAWFISHMFPARRAIWLALLNVAANFGGIGLGFAYLATLGNVGMVTLMLKAIGIPFDPPSPASFTGLAIGYLYTNVPLFVLLTIPAMGVLRNDWWEAAQTAAATRLQFWRYVGIPVLSPFIAAGWLLIFTWSIGLYGLAFALAGTGGATQVRLITLQIGLTLQSSAFGQERAAVLAVVLMVLATVSLLIYRVLLRRALRWFR